MSNRDIAYVGDYKALTRTTHGHKMYVDTRDRSLTPCILLDGYWENWIAQFFLQLVKPGMNMVEVGSNIGYYTLLAASHIGSGGKVYAFEANPEVYQILCSNLDINGFLDWTVLTNAAVADKSGKLIFNTLKRHQGSSSLVHFSEEFVKHWGDEMQSMEVEAVSLDDFFAGRELPIDLIKMDAEGSEGLIFQGMEKVLARNPNIKIIAEFSPGLMAATGVQPGEFLTGLIDSGFKVKVINRISRLEDVPINNLLQTPNCELFISRQG